jgi:hypothetical protein
MRIDGAGPADPHGDAREIRPARSAADDPRAADKNTDALGLVPRPAPTRVSHMTQIERLPSVVEHDSFRTTYADSDRSLALRSGMTTSSGVAPFGTSRAGLWQPG